MTHATDRRTFLTWLVFGLGAIFSAILGFPVVSYVLDPRHRRGKQSDFKAVDGIRLDELTLFSPKQGVIRDTRHDGWTLYPNDVVGRVWVVLNGQRPANLTGMDVAALERDFNKNEDEKKKYLSVFTTICPHLGCSVNLNATGFGFLCPCHSAAFNADGTRDNMPGMTNPAARSMDSLEWEIDSTDPERNRIRVKYLNFVSSISTKKMA